MVFSTEFVWDSGLKEVFTTQHFTLRQYKTDYQK